MILLFLWAIGCVLLGYEGARHGIVQIIVPGLYLLAMFVWVGIGGVLVHFISKRKPRRAPSPEEVRKAYGEMSKRAHDMGPGKAGLP